MELLRAAALVGLAGCFSPAGRDCAVTCAAGGDCPHGYVCLADRYCHTSSADPLCNLPDAAPQVTTTELEAEADTYVLELNALDNYGGDVAIAVDATAGSMRVSLLRFDLTAIPDDRVLAVPPVLRLCTTDAPSTTGAVEIYRVLERWSEGLGVRQPDETGSPGVANWTDRMAGTPWTNIGIGAPTSREPTAATVSGATMPVTAPSTSVQVEILPEIVDAWRADDATNFGLALLPAAGTDRGLLVARESPDTTCRPTLVVTHAAPGG